ncbi:MAG: universal stress protein [Pseudomonadota bacterium]
MTYRHILLAADLAPDTALVAERAKALAGPQTRITLVHVIEPLALAYGAEMPVDLGSLQEEITRQAQQRLDLLGSQLGIATADRVLATGTIEREILRLAGERQADLIVIGSHSRRGLAALLGSTANAVLHHARCDVLAVRIARD